MTPEEKQLRQEWETPPDFWEWLDELFKFNLDACASSDNAKSMNFITEEMDALSNRLWCDCLGGLIREKFTAYCNPGFSGLDKWIDRAVQASEIENLNTCILSHAATGSRWFTDRKHLMSEVWLLSPRIQFIAPKGIKQTSNSRDSMLMLITPQSVRLQRDPCVRLVDWKE